MTDLEKARQDINEIDKKMADLFEKRMAAAKTVAEYKKANGLRITDAAREQEVIKKNSLLINNEAIKPYFISFLQNNMDLSKAYQHKLIEGMHVAFSGVEGAFAGIAANRIFPTAVTVPHSSFKAAYDSVVNGKCDCAVLPIENSQNGDVAQVMDLTFFGPLYINGIYDIEVVQNLLAVKGTTIDEVKQVISHPQALGQCKKYIEKRNLKETEEVNTAVAAKKVAELNDHSIAAIGSVEAAKKYGLKVLEARINESSNNTTRFAVFSKTPKNESANDNFFVMLFTVNNEAGALGDAINTIGRHGFNLRALKSRPTKELIWSYYFYAEGEGNIHSENGKKMIEELKQKCSTIKIVGNMEKEIFLKGEDE